MNKLLVISCLIVTALLGSSQANLCETLAPRAVGGDSTPLTFVNLWVNQSFALYAQTTFNASFLEPYNETIRLAHVNFYGYIIGCSAVAPVDFPAPSTNMSDVHSGFAIPAADFVTYVELTRQALQAVVSNTTVAEIEQLYEIFESFREYNTTSTICNQADCQTPATIVIAEGSAEPVVFTVGYVVTSAATLVFDNPTTFEVDLVYVPDTAANCSSPIAFATLEPSADNQIVPLTFGATGNYYVFHLTAGKTECFVNTTLFSNNVLIVEYVLLEVPPVEPVAPPTVEVPIAEPVAENVTEPMAEPVSPPETPTNATEPMAEPVSPPETPTNATEPVTVDPPVQPPVAEVPVAVPVATVPVSAPVADGSITPTAETSANVGGYIAGIVILVLIVIGLLIAVIVMGVKLRRNSTIVVA